jgi:catechol 2,3-dioxygenase-like lactoylglutathione lyase family enzyme
MVLPKLHIHLGVCDAVRSTAFYQALLGTTPASRDGTTAVFELDSPPLILTVEQCSRPSPATASSPASLGMSDGSTARRASGGSRSGGRAHAATSRFDLLLDEPRLIGDVAVALRRAGVRLRLEDEGIEAHDPDGNAWRVRFVPSTKGRAVLPT